MRKVLTVLVTLALVAGVLVFLFREPLKQALYDRVTADMFVLSDADAFDPGPALGSRFPGLRARLGSREVTLLEEFSGTRGTILVASRSVDWCPFCMRQLIQLEEHRTEFENAGISLVAITYDEPEQQADFIRQHGMTIPLLSDIDAMTFKTLGILNRDYQPGDDHYGIPYPGMIVVDPSGTVVGKLFLEPYSLRIHAAAALSFAREVLELDGG